MAKIRKPKRGKGEPPKRVTTGNLKKPANSDTKDMVAFNFKVPRAFRKEFKQAALDVDMSMVELLQHCFQLHKDSLNR